MDNHYYRDKIMTDKKTIPLETVRKRDGSLVPFDMNRIINAINKESMGL